MTKLRPTEQECLSKPGYKTSQWHGMRDAFIVHPVKQSSGKLLDGETVALLGQIPGNPQNVSSVPVSGAELSNRLLWVLFSG